MVALDVPHAFDLRRRRRWWVIDDLGDIIICVTACIVTCCGVGVLYSCDLSLHCISKSYDLNEQF